MTGHSTYPQINNTLNNIAGIIMLAANVTKQSHPNLNQNNCYYWLYYNGISVIFIYASAVLLLEEIYKYAVCHEIIILLHKNEK